MSRRIILMFSMLVAAFAFLLISDLVSIQILYSRLDNVAMTVGYHISKNGGINETIKAYVKKEVNANIYCAMDKCDAVKVGDTYEYIIAKEYVPIILPKQDNQILLKRSVVIGMYTPS